MSSKKATADVDDIIVVYHPERNKNVLAFIEKVSIKDDDVIHCVIADETAAYDSTRETFTTSRKVIKAVLGQEPDCFGKIWGLPIHPFFDKITVKGWGDVLFHYPADDPEYDNVEEILTRVVLTLKGDKIAPLFHTTHIHEANPKDKYAGWYHYRPKKEADKIIYNVSPERKLTLLTGIHEPFHGYWFRNLKPETRALWIELYHDMVMNDALQGNVIGAVMADFKNLQGSTSLKRLLADYRKDQLHEHIKVVHSILKAIREEHCLDKFDIQDLLAANRPMDDYLPTLKVIKKGVAETSVTKYANKNTREFFCESFATFYNGDDLPDEVIELVEDTIIDLRGGGR